MEVLIMKAEFNVHGIIVPHVPTLLEDEMDQKPSKVITELRELGQRMKAWGVEAVVVADTHWQTGDRFFIDDSPLHQTETTYYGFRKEVEYDVPGNTMRDVLKIEFKPGEDSGGIKFLHFTGKLK
jgi:aromatic ring-opening dioxygenase catalytic subunit (LigB family)